MNFMYYLTRCFLLLVCSLTFVGCTSVDFEPHKKQISYDEDSQSHSIIHTNDITLNGYKPIGKMYIGGNNSSTKSKNPWDIELTRKRAKYQASTSIYQSAGKSSNLLLSVNRGNELQTGLTFSFDLDLFR